MGKADDLRSDRWSKTKVAKGCSWPGTGTHFADERNGRMVVSENLWMISFLHFNVQFRAIPGDVAYSRAFQSFL